MENELFDDIGAYTNCSMAVLKRINLDNKFCNIRTRFLLLDSFCGDDRLISGIVNKQCMKLGINTVC